jgi:transposase InsO family protein
MNRTVKPKQYEFDDEIIKVFEEAESRYGARRIRKQLRLEGIVVSRRKIRQIMIKNALVSLYTVKQYKPDKSSSNQEKVEMN